MILLKPMLRVYVTRVRSFGSTTDSSRMQTDWALKKRSPHLGTRFVLLRRRFEWSWPSRISRQTVSSERTWELWSE